MKIILLALFIPSILYAADFPHRTNPYILKELHKEKREPSTWEKMRAIEREQYYSIPPENRPSWKEFKSYPPKVRVED